MDKLNIMMAWVATFLFVLSSVIYLLKFNKRITKTKIYKFLRKRHIAISKLLIVTSIIHGYLSSYKLLSLNAGSITLFVFILLALSFYLRKKLKINKTWIIYHRYLTLIALIVLALHLLFVQPFIGLSVFFIDAPQSVETNIEASSIPQEISVTDNSVEETNTQIVNDNNIKDQSIQNTSQIESEDINEVNLSTQINNTPNSEVTNLVESSVENSDSIKSNIYNDGIYYGTADGFGRNLKVEVKIKDNKIIYVEIVSHNERNARFYAPAFNKVPQSIVDNQSTDVDTVSGATYSSVGIINATKAALRQALVEGEISPDIV